MKIFEPTTVGGLELRNPIVMPPMCMYFSQGNGMAGEEHLVHYATRAVGGAGLIILEATGVAPEGRISDRCLGLWMDRQIPGLERIVRACRKAGARTAIQLNHAGRKSVAKGKELLAPSALAFDGKSRIPKEMDAGDIAQVVGAFRDAAARARKAGFDLVEVHGAHGYLISEFLSPLSNKREDAYGGGPEGRSRFLREVLEAVRESFQGPVCLRVSASDWTEGGMTPEEMTEILNGVRGLVDLVHVSSGGVVPVALESWPGYQVPFAEAIRRGTGLPVIAVGMIRTPELAEEILQNGRGDLVGVGRELLRNPYWLLQAARKAGVPEFPYPVSYLDGFFKRR